MSSVYFNLDRNPLTRRMGYDSIRDVALANIINSLFEDMYIEGAKMAGLSSWLPEGCNINIQEVGNGYIVSKNSKQYIARTEKEVLKVVLQLLKEKKQ